MAAADRLEVIGKQNTLFGKAIDLVQFKNLEEKRKIKQKVKDMFNGKMFRSIITPREVDGNKRLNKLERQNQSGDKSSVENTMERADSFGKKSLNTLSTYPSTLTIAYTTLLSVEGDKVIDPFMGHNSRAEDILTMKRKYYGYDVHKFPIDFTQKAIERFSKDDYELNLASSEKMQYEDNSMDFGFTCPPYADVEQYNKIYNEKAEGDLSAVKYEEFLRLYQNCISETFRVLRPGKFFVITIGDVHRNGKFISLSNDTDKICEQVGFIKHDENIYNRKSNIGGDLNYKTFILTCKRFPTIHEYILIYKKPEKGEKNTIQAMPKIQSPQLKEEIKEPVKELTREEKLNNMGEIEKIRFLEKEKRDTKIEEEKIEQLKEENKQHSKNTLF